MKKKTTIFKPDHIRKGKDLYLLPEVDIIYCEIWMAERSKKYSTFTFTVYSNKVTRVPIAYSGLLGRSLNEVQEELEKGKWKVERII